LWLCFHTDFRDEGDQVVVFVCSEDGKRLMAKEVRVAESPRFNYRADVPTLYNKIYVHSLLILGEEIFLTSLFTP
jgi:hypothetical protein